MASHSGRSFLNSCLKVPIDPCNNCPAPTFNRSKMYLGRLSMTPTTALATTTVITATKTCDTEFTEPKWSCGGIRSLAKFYDSIPGFYEHCQTVPITKLPLNIIIVFFVFSPIRLWWANPFNRRGILLNSGYIEKHLSWFENEIGQFMCHFRWSQ